MDRPGKPRGILPLAYYTTHARGHEYARSDEYVSSWLRYELLFDHLQQHCLDTGSLRLSFSRP